VLAALLCLAALAPARGADVRPGGADIARVAAVLERFVAHEMADKELPGLAVALVDGEETVWARGFGLADAGPKTAMTTETVLRVGSVSKLFTDLAVMQLVERGELDLDAPVTAALPDFAPANRFGKAITLRMLLAHRSGLVREPPVGSYFEPTTASLAEVVKSLNQTALVYEPGTRTKYSNAGITVVGRMLEARDGVPFAVSVKRRVLEPLGLTHSTFGPEPIGLPNLARGLMWTYDGRTFPGPRFELGIAPACSLSTTVKDLGRFLSALFAGGRGARGVVASPATLSSMWTLQFAAPDEKRGFGLGFHISTLDGRRRVGHDGAVYGFATSLAALPDDRLGVAVVATRDCANAVTERIAEAALRLLLARREGRPLPEPEVTAPVERARARRLAGRYASEEATALVEDRSGALFLSGSDAPERLRLRAHGGDLVVDDVLAYGLRVTPGDRTLRIGTRTYSRVEDPRSLPVSPRWADLVGEYGPEHDRLYLRERDGRLEALIEWFTAYPLTEVAPDELRFPDRGLYAGEVLRVVRDAGRRAAALRLNGIVFTRAWSGVDGGGTFRVTPNRPVAELTRAALLAEPPPERGDLRRPDLVELVALDPTIKLDIRYATGNNFLGTPVYALARAYLQRPAALALARAHRALAGSGYGLLIHDAYRPWYVTRVFWDATPADKHVFVANPAQGSRHNRGCAVDLTLYQLADGRPVEMTGVYDEMSERSYPEFPGGTSEQRWHRERLRAAMEGEGFTVNDAEWWHFDYQEWRRYPILNLTFERLGARASSGPDR
jgi:CubicO group peptidase (beta-lactamase class C family)/D-alanyl-D-alanine dipeptidase